LFGDAFSLKFQGDLTTCATKATDDVLIVIASHAAVAVVEFLLESKQGFCKAIDDIAILTTPI